MVPGILFSIENPVLRDDWDLNQTALQSRLERRKFP